MNSFQTFIESIDDYFPKLFAYLRNAPDNTLVHFSKVDKLGLNPKPAHEDPIGIYAFPKSYVLSKNFEKNHHFFSMPYVFILKLKSDAKILNLSKITSSQLEEMLDKLNLKAYRDKKHLKDRESGKAGHILWDSIEKYMHEENLYGQKKNMTWNKMFRKLGDYDALKDDGDAIIHSNEPSQVLILNPTAYIQLDKFTTDAKKSYKDIGIYIVQKISTHLFGDYKITTRKESYDNIIISSDGKIDGKIFRLSFHYSQNPSGWTVQKGLDRPIYGTIYLSNRHLENYTSKKINIPIDDKNHFKIDEYIDNIIYDFESFVKTSQYREDMNPQVKKLIQEICWQLGFGKMPNLFPSTEGASYKKVYPQGTLSINVGYHESLYTSSGFFCSMTMKNEKSLMFKYSINGLVELSKEEVLHDLPAAAKKFINGNLIQWESHINNYYNPDERKYPQRERDMGYSWERSETGKKLLQFIGFLKSKTIR